MPIVKDILLQLLFITVPVLVYKNVWLDRNHSRKRSLRASLFIVLVSLSVIFCMSFPIHVDQGMRFDLRSIPVIVAILYGGYIPGIVTAVVMLAYRLYLGGDGIAVAFVAFGLYAIVPFHLVPRWYDFSFRKKMGYVFLIGCIKECVSILAASYLLFAQGQPQELIIQHLKPMAEISVVYVLALAGVIYLVEFIRESFVIRHQIERSEKLNLISELAASVAHEVRNPLTVVRGFVQLLREDNNSKNNEYIRLVLNELDRAEFIISDYLNMAKPQGERMERIEIAHLVREVTALMSSFAVMNGVEIVIRTEEGLFINGNPVKLKQALMNLMKNGVESMQQGGVLDVRLEQAGGEVIISIRDQGEGMSSRQIEQIGLPFYSTKEKGTGLGLMVTCRIIEAMNGRIKFASVQGQGTQVTVSMPVVYG